jgi:hypothetical protein
MEARELMKGNLVMYYNKIHRIQTVGQWCYTDLSSDEIPIDKLKPIPLTDEWLVRFGFIHENNEYFNRFVLHGFFVEFDIEDDCYYVGVESGGRNISKISHVHRLQNLFF